MVSGFNKSNKITLLNDSLKEKSVFGAKNFTGEPKKAANTPFYYNSI